jgi:2-dehydropantoate 2-reductase
MAEAVGIFGAGALGTLLATRIAAGGREVHVLARSAARAEALRRASPLIRVHSAAADLPPSALHFLCVKAYDTESAAGALAESGTRPAGVCSLQNGLGNMEALDARLPGWTLIAGATRLGAYLDPSGALHASTDGLTQVAPWGRADIRGAEDAAAILSAAGLRTEVVPDAREMLWKKLVLNAAVNPLPAIANRENGVLLEEPALWRVAEAVALEAARVGVRIGALPGDFDPRPLVRQLVEETRSNRGSMTEDLNRGRRTEADAILGSLVRASRDVGEAIPTLEGLWELIQDAEAGKIASAKSPHD